MIVGLTRTGDTAEAGSVGGDADTTGGDTGAGGGIFKRRLPR